MSYIKKRGLSFRYAFNGLTTTLREPNFTIQVIAAVVAIALGLWFGITKTEWCIIIGCCMLVISLELLNSAIERLCNRITTQTDPAIKIIKDACAAAVLVASAGSLVIGVIVFRPYLEQLFS